MKKELRKKKKRVKKGVQFERIVKLLGFISKMVIIGIFVYVVISRVQEVNGLGWFFTTWR